ncbi:MAG TPA: ABC transporter ATP-binding protein [Acidimicrobiales bacterium]
MTAATGANGAGTVDLESVTKRFGSVVAVDDLTLHIEAGEFLSLLGPSGCGKTTTLRMLAGFEDPDAGVVRLSGRDITRVPAYRRDVNTVFQHYALFPHMSVAENVAYGLRQKGVDKGDVRRRVGDALEMVKMTRYARRKPRQLSGGQQQRVALARALVNRPAVLLLDEPLGALDRKLRQEMQIELKLIQTSVGTTFVYVTHDQEEALSMSDRIAVMLDGRIEQLGTPEEVYDRPASAFVAGFIGQQNFLVGTATADGSGLEADGCRVAAGRVAADVAAGQAAIAAVRPEYVQVADTDPGAATNVLKGTLAGTAHLGELVQYVVTTPAGAEVISRQPRASAPRLAVGEPVWCSWDAADAHLFGAGQRHLVLPDPGEPSPTTEPTAAPA